jgi:hypothetical protein
MVRYASHFDGKLIRANRAVLLGLLWAGLFACFAAASVYDLGRWVDAW